MKSRYTPVCMAALMLAACSTAPTPTQSVEAEKAPQQAKTYHTQALTANFNSAIASSLEPGSAPSRAVDNLGVNTAWRSAFRPRTASLTVSLTNPMVLTRINLRMNTFLPGTYFDVQTSTNGKTWRNVARRQVSNVNGAKAISPTGAAATAKYIRLVFQNTAGLNRRVDTFFVSNIAVQGTATTLTNGGVPNYAWVDLFAAVVQNRPDTGRLRYEAGGLTTDPAQITLNDVGYDVLSNEPSLRLTGSAIMRVGGRRELNLPVIDLPAIPDEPGIVLGADTNNDELELIWPELGGDPPGNAIVRVQDGNISRDYAGELANANFTIQAWSVKDNTLVYQWTGRAPSTEVPPAR